MHNLLEHTQACEDRDFVEWHKGCPWCAVWVLRVDTPQLVEHVHRARDCLMPWVLPRYERQPHITVAYRGLMDVDAKYPHAEFGAHHLQADVRALQQALVMPFAVKVNGCDSFTTVPYLAVEGQASLETLHQTLAPASPYPDWRYVPHVTLGHYGCEVPMAEVMKTVQDCFATRVLCVPIDALWLARYRTHDISGPLHWEGRFDLHTQQYHPQPDALFFI